MLASMGKEAKTEVSLHEVLVWRGLDKKWRTHKEIFKKIGGKVAERTVRAHTQKLVALGLIEVVEVFPGHRYRIKATSTVSDYIKRLEAAAEAFGVA